MLESAELGSQLWFPERGSVLQHPDFKGVKFVLDFPPKWLLRLYYLKVSYFIDFFCCEKILEKEKEKKSSILAHVFFFFFFFNLLTVLEPVMRQVIMGVSGW